jgi:hypothetical protein
VPPPAPVWCGLGARGHAAARGNICRARAVRERADASGVGLLRPTPLRARVYFMYRLARAFHTNLTTTPVEGYLGSRNDEERSEMRYVM